MVATWNPAASAGYYTKQTAYYTHGEGVEGPGYWFAPACDFDLIDHSQVNPEAFENLFAGVDRNGNLLLSNSGNRIDRVAAFDITFSAPRSISLLWALGDKATREAVERAHTEAVRQTLELLENEAAYARRGQGGGRIEPVALSAACFMHGESRPAEHADGFVFADPNLHTHCVVLNIAMRADGTVGALHSTILRDWKMAAGALYHAAITAGVIKHGFAIDRVAKNGIFEIEGIDDSAIKYFSARRQEILDELGLSGAREGGNMAALAAAAAKSTRSAKTSEGLSREESWIAAARRIGFDPQATIELASGTRPELDIGAQNERLSEKLAHLPKLLTETKSVLSRRELFRAVAEAIVGSGFGVDRVELEVANLLERGQFLEIGRDRLGLPRYSTPEMIRIEREIVEMSARMASTSAFEISEKSTIARHGLDLSEEQQAAVLSAISPGRLALVEGAPGTGKTTLLAPAVATWKEAGYRVIGTATAWRIANALRDDLDIEARARASWLARAEQGLPFLDARTVLVVDEAGLLSSRETHALLTAASKATAKVLLVGDRDQLQAIGAGSGLRLVSQAIDAAKVKTIVRQHEPWAREAVTSIGEGNTRQALDAFASRGLLIEADGQQPAIKAVVDRVEHQLLGSDPQSALIMAKTNAEVAAIGREVRERLRSHSLINGPDVAVDAVTPSGHSTQLDLAAGDRIRFLVRNDKLGVINGTIATVTAVRHDHSVSGAAGAIVAARIGTRIVEFNTADLADGNGRARLGWAYASTVYGSQGMTVDHAAVLLTPAFDRHDTYVAASRARQETTLVVDNRRLDQEMAAGVQTSATNDAETRRHWLSDRLAVAHAKETTLDFASAGHLALTQSSQLLPGQTQTRDPAIDHLPSANPQRAREISHEL